MKLKDGIKCGLGFAIGWSIWNGLICDTANRLLRIYYQSDYWKKVYESMPEALQEFYKPLKPKDAKTEEDFKFGFQDSESSGS